MFRIFRTKTFWAALATGVTGALHSIGIAPEVLSLVTWGFGVLTAVCMRAGVEKSGAAANPVVPPIALVHGHRIDTN